ncbi:hypothetical protein GSI_12797 [Ganoderma sinense ZZ0214-1]|uniref:Uncharacterized protein n=1 Tax=Ganoderma sinense ZZ0214-1 TaxID=1077348 RepID=A0A2G8RTT1_9APHY|nr:hypothetical protein GSI_12797 [Ganoderma sinense ZZ0214-1]
MGQQHPDVPFLSSGTHQFHLRTRVCPLVGLPAYPPSIMCQYMRHFHCAYCSVEEPGKARYSESASRPPTYSTHTAVSGRCALRLGTYPCLRPQPLAVECAFISSSSWAPGPATIGLAEFLWCAWFRICPAHLPTDVRRPIAGWEMQARRDAAHETSRQGSGRRASVCVRTASLQPARVQCSGLTPQTTYSPPARGAWWRRTQAQGAASQASSTLNSRSRSAACVNAGASRAFALETLRFRTVLSPRSRPRLPIPHRTLQQIRQDAGQCCLRRFPQTAVAHTANAVVERCHGSESGSLQRGHPTRAIHPRCPHVRTHGRAHRSAGS